MARNPFALSDSRAGHGVVHLIVLPPSSVKFKELTYTYPLKLVTSTPHTLASVAPLEGRSDLKQLRPISVPLLFLLSYGGGLLPPDTLSINIILDPISRLTIATQGSTKIFPSPSRETLGVDYRTQDLTPIRASQNLRVELRAHSALLLSPDPTQPFRNSNYSQTQIFNVHEGASLGLLDWVTAGRPARGETWDATSWRGRNEIWRVSSSPSPTAAGSEASLERRLLLRDSAILSDGAEGVGQSTLKAEGMGVFGTVILYGPLFEELGTFFLDEFGALPRIGGREWDDGDLTTSRGPTKSTVARNLEQELGQMKLGMQSPEGRSTEDIVQIWRKGRQTQEKADELIWTAARVRGMVLVKFAAREVSGVKEWLRSMWMQDGTVGREFGPGGLISVS